MTRPNRPPTGPVNAGGPAAGAASTGDIAPMLATPGHLPTADADFAYEMKWDGVRAIVYLAGGTVRILARSGRDVSIAYPELASLGGQVGHAVLDGEIVAFGSSGRPDFGLLQQRMHVDGAALAARLSGTVPVMFLAFDLLRMGPTPLLEQPYTQRRELLERLDLDGPNWQTPPAFQGGGAQAWQASRTSGLEGVVAKRLTSVYHPGARSRDWIKIKNVRTQEVVIGGWRTGKGGRAGSIGSLLVGLPAPTGLRYIGHVGTGFSDAVLADLTARLRVLQRETSPFAQPLPRVHARDAHWVEPNLVGEVAFAEWTTDAILRHPSWRGLRPDKRADQVVQES